MNSQPSEQPKVTSILDFSEIVVSPMPRKGQMGPQTGKHPAFNPVPVAESTGDNCGSSCCASQVEIFCPGASEWETCEDYTNGANEWETCEDYTNGANEWETCEDYTNGANEWATCN
jgi:hypothetical protein